MKPLCFLLALAVVFVVAFVQGEAKPYSNADTNADADADPTIISLVSIDSLIYALNNSQEFKLPLIPMMIPTMYSRKLH
jgi:hypothetical protein